MMSWRPCPKASTTTAHSLNAQRIGEKVRREFQMFKWGFHCHSGRFFVACASRIPMNKTLRLKLFIMMVLELLIWGAWLPLINGYMENALGFAAWQRTWVNNAFAVASIT